MLTLISLVLVSPLAQAQDHPEPAPRPAPKPIAPTATAPRPVRDDSIPGLEDADFRLPLAPLRREGSFIVRQRGSLVRLPGGERAFVFHRDKKGRAERPMVLLPCLTLQSMEQVVGDRAEDTVFLITGQVYAYHSVNYLLPSAAPVAGLGESPESGSDDRPPVKTPPKDPAKEEPAKTADPDVADLIRDLEAQRERPRTLGSAPQPKAIEAPASTDLLPENTTISLRRGRLVRMTSGDWAFVFDNGPNSDSAADRTLILNPCLNLQRLESWASQLGDGASILVSGRVYQYHSRNHLIPTMYQVSPPADLSPR